MQFDVQTLLFSPFYREVGNPKRMTISSREDFDRFIQLNNGVNDCFVSVYDWSFVIDKIFQDVDCGGVKQELDDAKTLFYYCQERGLDVLPLASGKKGIHLHILLRPTKYSSELEAKNRLYTTTMGLLEKVFGPLDEGMEYDSNGKARYCYYITKEEGGKIIRDRRLGIDPKVVGDTRRLCRIPDTLRPPENNSYCVVLDSDKFLRMDWSDVVRATKTLSDVGLVVPKRKYSLDDLPKLCGFELDYKPKQSIIHEFKELDVKKASVPLLEEILRPCLYRHLTMPEPSHEVRVAATIDLLQVFSPRTIADFYVQLGWIDFDYDKTLYQIGTCKKYNQYSCKKLRQLKIPEVCCVG